jgi:uncharacterized protein YqgQ
MTYSTYGAIGIVLLAIGLIFYRVYITPLAKVPNAHPLAPFTGLWILWVRYREQVNLTVYQAHKKHGPIVRLGPSELSIAMYEDGVKTVYSTKKFHKHGFYRAFWNYG